MRINVEITAINRAKRLAKSLAISQPEALGRLIYLWHWSQEELSLEATQDEIVFWFDEESKFEPEKVIAALLGCKFISHLEDKNYRIHGNEKHVARLEKWREASKKGGEVMRQRWEAKRSQKDSQAASPTGATVASSNTNQPKPIQPKPTQTSPIQDTLLPSPKATAPPGLPMLARTWNLNCGKLPKVRSVNAGRLKRAKLRWNDFAEGNPESYWTEVIKRIAASNFCNGASNTAWVATFDWILQPDTHLKVMEGKYDNRRGMNRADRATNNLQNLWDETQAEKGDGHGESRDEDLYDL